ncbi:lipoxygenase 1, chloroplastic [Tanacetum coccineum]
MALAKELMGTSIFQEKQPSFTNSKALKPMHHNHVPISQKVVVVVKSAISEDIAKFVTKSDKKDSKKVSFKVRGVLTVRNKVQEDFKETLVKKIDAFADQLIGRNVVLELFSLDIDPKTRAPKKSKEAVLKDWSQKANLKSEKVNYTSDILVESDFGVPGAITITNKHQKEFYLESITIEGFACGPVYFPCNSWVQSVNDHAEPRIFFSNQREGASRFKGRRNMSEEVSDRIYDYDVYSDLGNPDRGNDFIRPLLAADLVTLVYEQFDESKQNTFSTSRLKAVLHNLLPSMVASISKKHDFKGFSQIESLYSEGVLLKLGLQDDLIKKLRLPNLVTRLHESSQGGGLLKYDTPKILSKDRFSWLRDDEFARQALAGVNPVSIEKLKVFPPVSQLDPEIYGRQESALKEEHILGYLNGMSVQQMPLATGPGSWLKRMSALTMLGFTSFHTTAIQNWVQTYVNRYYPDPSLVCNDRELQAWYAEVINVGHADLRYENWWPTLANAEDLTAILTTIIWLASAQHAALNFGQYPYGGYIPNRPPRMRRLIPDENDPEYASFLEDPQNYFLLALPSMLQSTKYMAVVDTLSTHSPDEEYIGERQQRDTWSGDAEMVEAFYGFASEIQRIEKEIEKRNRDMSLKNRCGAGVLPYELLAPSSEPGVTCRGIPNSVSI